MGKRLFVGGISYNINDAQLKDLFLQFGTVVSVTIVTDRFSGQSKGFGFVEMGSDEEANKAVQGLNGTEVEGRKITVDIAKPREERPASNFGGSRGGPREDADRRSTRGRPNRW